MTFLEKIRRALRRADRRDSEAGYTIDVLGGNMIYLYIAAGLGLLFYMGFSKSKLSSMEQTLTVTRQQVQQAFSGESGFTGLTNTLAINMELVPKSLIMEGTLINDWNGNFTLAPAEGNTAFSITVTRVPRSECAQLARFQSHEWISVLVNGGSAATLTDAASACASDQNTIVYTAR